MIKNVIAMVLFGISVFLSLKHGWDAFQAPSQEQSKMMAELGITKTAMPYFGIFSILIGLMLIWHRTFFLGNMLNAMVILIIMALSLRAGNYKMALIEIPFLAMPLLLIYLKYPFKP